MTTFNARHGLIIVQVALYGPTGDTQAYLALDTGATATVVSKEVLSQLVTIRTHSRKRFG